MSDQTQDKPLWTDEQHDAYALGMQTEREHQNALSKLAVRMHQEQIDDLEQRLAAVVAERDQSRQRVAELEQGEAWGYSGQATMDVYGGGLIKMRMDGPFPEGAPDSGVYDIVFRLMRRTRPATAQEQARPDA